MNNNHIDEKNIIEDILNSDTDATGDLLNTTNNNKIHNNNSNDDFLLENVDLQGMSSHHPEIEEIDTSSSLSSSNKNNQLMHIPSPVPFMFDTIHNDSLLHSNLNNNNNNDINKQIASNVTRRNNNAIDNNNKKKITKTRPTFVNKVWSMLQDPKNVSMIHWNDDGTSFIVSHRDRFVKEILPNYFKHSNFASFVRQLNMYGWHKVQDILSGSLNVSDERWEFANDNFLKGREDLLVNIVRQKSNAHTNGNNNINMNSNNNNNNNNGHININHKLLGMTGDNSGNANGGNITEHISSVLNELDQLKYNQINISKDLIRLRKDNELLWKENMIARERHRTQQQALEKILRFLTNMMPQLNQKLIEPGPSSNSNNTNTSVHSTSNKRKRDVFENNNQVNNNNDIFEELIGNNNISNDSIHNNNNINNSNNNGNMNTSNNSNNPNKKLRYLLKNYEHKESPENDSDRNTISPLNLFNDSTNRISEINDDETHAYTDKQQDNKNQRRASSTTSPVQEVIDSMPIVEDLDNDGLGEDSTQLNNLQHNIDEQDIRIQHLEDMVHLMNDQDFDLPNYLETDLADPDNQSPNFNFSMSPPTQRDSSAKTPSQGPLIEEVEDSPSTII